MQRVAILYDASQAVLSTFDLDEVLNQILEIVRDYFHLHAGSIWLLDSKSQLLYIQASFGLDEDAPDRRMPIGAGIPGAAVRLRRPVYVPDVTKDPRYIQELPSTRSELAIPLLVRDEVVGVLDCCSDSVAHFDNETVDLLTLFATQASIGLQNARLYSMLQARAAQLEMINSLAKQTTVELDLKELLDRLCAQLPVSFGIDHVAVLLRDEDGRLVLRAQHGSLNSRLRLGHDFEPPVHSCPLPDSSLEARCIDLRDCPDPCFEGARSEVNLPLISFGENIGVLVCSSKAHNAFQENDIKALESVADIVATAVQNARYVERVKQLAYRDGLTGVFNRRYFEQKLLEEMARSLRFGKNVAVLMIDLDHFKSVNDEFGHILGDEVLRQCSQVFWKLLRKVDIICRYGGEEFAIILPETSASSATNVAEKLRKAVARKEIPGVPRPVTISIGVSEYPANGITRDELISAADSALYLAKQSGRNQVRIAPVASSATK